MSKFTPGPWKVIGTSSTDKEQSNAIVVCPDGRSFDCGDLIYHPENYSNAKLISKAPELYGIVRDLRYTLITVYRDDEDQQLKNMIDNVCERAQKLLNEIDQE